METPEPNLSLSNVSACSAACDDLQLMNLVYRRNTKAFHILVERYLARGISVAQRSGMDYESAQDIVAESFIKIWNRADAFQPCRGKFSSWFFTIVHNLAIDELRRTRAYTEVKRNVLNEYLVSSSMDSPEDQMFKNLDQIAVRSALDQLPEAERQVIRLAYLEGVTRREIAKQLKLPLGTVHSRVRTGMQHLSQLLREEPKRKEWRSSGKAERDVQSFSFAQAKA